MTREMLMIPALLTALGMPALDASPAQAQAPAYGQPYAQPAQGRRITFNGRPVDAQGAQVVAQIEQRLGQRVPDGDYWYDARSGAVGAWGGPTIGFLPAGLPLGGPLPANASGGMTSVLINGRAVHPQELAYLTRLLGQIPPGRYFLDANGNAGPEGGPPTVNLVAAAQQAGGRSGGGGDNFWWSRYGAAGNSDGDAGYISLPNGGSVTWGM